MPCLRTSWSLAVIDRHRPSSGESRQGNVVGKDAVLEHGAVAVEGFQVLLGNLVGRSALGAPLAAPDPGATDHRIRVHHVRAYAPWRAFERKAAAELDFCGLGGAIST